MSKEEIAKLVQGFEKQDILTSSGVTLAGSRYIYLSGTDRVVRAKLGKVGVHCMKTQQGRHMASLTFQRGSVTESYSDKSLNNVINHKSVLRLSFSNNGK